MRVLEHVKHQILNKERGEEDIDDDDGESVAQCKEAARMEFPIIFHSTREKASTFAFLLKEELQAESRMLSVSFAVLACHHCPSVSR